MVKHVGMIPLLAKRAGNPIMAGPVSAFTAIDMDPEEVDKQTTQNFSTQ